MISIRNLKISFNQENKTITPVDMLDLDVSDGEILGLVGKSGCGKSVLSSACLGMVEYPGVIESGHIYFENKGSVIDLTKICEKQWYSIRGKYISIIFQNSVSALNPARTIGSQFVEAIRIHDKKISKIQALNIIKDKLTEVMLAENERILRSFPFELSGGMCQRIMIAMAMVHQPKFLIADEPTTALDTKTQAQILSLFLKLNKEYGTAILFISHDLNVVRSISHRIAKMQEGKIFEVIDN